MEKHTVQQDNGPDLNFEGELVGEAYSRGDQSHRRYSGSPGRRTTLKLYRTKGGRFICEKIGHTQWQGEKTRYKAHVCDLLQEVFEFFGHGWLEKDLYKDAGIDASTKID